MIKCQGAAWFGVQARSFFYVSGGILLLTIAYGLGATGVLGQSEGKRIVEAQQFILKDSAGNTQAILAPTAKGPALVMYGENGSPRIAIAVDGETSRIGLYGTAGARRAVYLSLSVKDQIGMLGFYDTNDHLRSVMGLDPNGASLGIVNEDGKLSAMLRDTRRGSMFTCYYPNSQHVGVLLGIDRERGATFSVMDDNGNPLLGDGRP